MAADDDTSERSGAGRAKKAAKRSTASKKQASSRRSASKQSASKQSASKQPTSKRAAPKRSRSGGPKATEVAEQAAGQLSDLLGREPEAVTGLRRTDDGWTVQVEVLELRRVPNTTDVLALYDVEVDGQGELVGYRRVRRYVRGTPSEE
jgi:hypothetical protein